MRVVGSQQVALGAEQMTSRHQPAPLPMSRQQLQPRSPQMLLDGKPTSRGRAQVPLGGNPTAASGEPTAASGD